MAFCTEATDDYHKKSLKVVAVQIMRGGPCNKKRFNYTCPFFYNQDHSITEPEPQFEKTKAFVKLNFLFVFFLEKRGSKQERKVNNSMVVNDLLKLVQNQQVLLNCVAVFSPALKKDVP